MSTAEKEKQSGKIITDPELVALAKIDRLLKGLEDSARTRVLAWLVARYTAGKFRMIVTGEQVDDQPPPGDPAYRKGASEAPDGDRR